MSVNAALRNQQESERLQGIMDKLEVYDVVVSLYPSLMADFNHFISPFIPGHKRRGAGVGHKISFASQSV